MSEPGLPRRFWIRIGLSLIFGALILAVVADQIDFIPDDVSVDPAILGGYVVVMVAYLLARAGRWWILLRPLGDIRWSTATWVGLAGIMWILLLPFRLGEFARPILVSRVSEITISRALGAVALERVVDGLVVCGLFFAVLGGDPPTGALAPVYDVGVWVMAAFGAALLALVLMAVWPSLLGKIVQATLGRIAPGLAARFKSLAEGISEGLAALPSPVALLSFLVATAAYWAINVAGAWFLALGCGLALSLPEMGAIIAVASMALLVPAGPALVGNFQAGVALGLSLFLPADVVLARGSVFVFWLYVIQLAAPLLAGILAHQRLGLGWREILRAEPAD